MIMGRGNKTNYQTLRHHFPPYDSNNNQATVRVIMMMNSLLILDPFAWRIKTLSKSVFVKDLPSS